MLRAGLQNASRTPENRRLACHKAKGPARTYLVSGSTREVEEICQKSRPGAFAGHLEIPPAGNPGPSPRPAPCPAPACWTGTLLPLALRLPTQDWEHTTGERGPGPCRENNRTLSHTGAFSVHPLPGAPRLAGVSTLFHSPHHPPRAGPHRRRGCGHSPGSGAGQSLPGCRSGSERVSSIGDVGGGGHRLSPQVSEVTVPEAWRHSARSEPSFLGRLEKATQPRAVL